MLQKTAPVDQRKLKIARHETGHAVMALWYGQKIQEISLKEMDSPHGTDKYQAYVKLETADPQTKFTGEKTIQKIMVSLGGYASEILFYDGSANIGGDDLTVAEKITEDMLQVAEFRRWAVGLPVPPPGALDMIKNPTARAYIDRKMCDCVETLAPLRPVIQVIAEELYKKEALTGEEVAILFNSFKQSNRPASAQTSMKATENYEICYPNPLNLKVGDNIQLFHKDGPEKWRDWKWCKASTGNEGWISETYFKRDTDSEATIVKDYHAKEIAVRKDESIDLLFTDCGWSWCRKANGDEGWLPTEILI